MTHIVHKLHTLRRFWYDSFVEIKFVKMQEHTWMILHEKIWKYHHFTIGRWPIFWRTLYCLFFTFAKLILSINPLQLNIVALLLKMITWWCMKILVIWFKKRYNRQDLFQCNFNNFHWWFDFFEVIIKWSIKILNKQINSWFLE